MFFEYNEAKGWFRTDELVARMDTYGFVTLCDNITDEIASKFIDGMKWKYPNLEKSNEKLKYPTLKVILEEFELFSIYVGLRGFKTHLPKTVKVSKTVVPRHFARREEFELKIGEAYYVNFDGYTAKRCQLLKVLKDQAGNSVVIEIKRGKSVTIYANEIGRTPEEAVMNRVSN